MKPALTRLFIYVSFRLAVYTSEVETNFRFGCR
jgi:hypothetical protein